LFPSRPNERTRTKLVGTGPALLGQSVLPQPG
jgi:hypothetical protein